MNEHDGNPIEIAAVVVWRIVETFEAVFNVDDYENFVHVQSEAAVRNLATTYPYDSHDDAKVSLRLSAGGEVADRMRHEVQERLSKAGIEVIEARISHLAYAPEIAGAMLRRQQASAVIAARQKIVEGAVGMVEMALNELSRKNVVVARRRAQGGDGEQSARRAVQRKGRRARGERGNAVSVGRAGKHDGRAKGISPSARSGDLRRPAAMGRRPSSAASTGRSSICSVARCRTRDVCPDRIARIRRPPVQRRSALDSSGVPAALLKSTPRDVRVNARGPSCSSRPRCSSWSVCGAEWFSAGAPKSPSVTSGLFASERIVTAGDIVRLQKRGGGDDHRIIAHYRYTARGEEFMGQTTLRRSERERYAVGSPVGVWYLPSEPERAGSTATRLGREASWPAPSFPIVCGITALVLIQLVRRQSNLLANGRPAMATVTKVEKKRTDKGTVVDGALRVDDAERCDTHGEIPARKENSPCDRRRDSRSCTTATTVSGTANTRCRLSASQRMIHRSLPFSFFLFPC